MILNNKVFKMLGGKYKDKFKIGEYVEYRRISRDENYTATYKWYQGIITKIKCYDSGGRLVWYAKIMKNGGEIDLVLLSKIRKIETN